MRMPWNKAKTTQLDLLPAAMVEPIAKRSGADPNAASEASCAASPAIPCDSTANVAANGQPLVVPVTRLYEGANNPRSEILDADLDELAEDIRQHGILQPIVVHPEDSTGRYCIHFGAKRLRAAQRAGLEEVPVVVRDAPSDPYTQVAENQKRHGLTPLDLARFIRGRVEAGDSNATVAKRLGMNLTTVAHHLAMLDLPPELDQALKSGRCTSPRTLHQLCKLHDEQPERVRALVAGGAEITRDIVAVMRAASAPTTACAPISSPAATRLAQAATACTRLEQSLDRLKKAKHEVPEADLAALRCRIAHLATRLA